MNTSHAPHTTKDGMAEIRRRYILAALDGSPAAASALPIARALAAQLDADLHILYVTDPSTSTPEIHAAAIRQLAEVPCSARHIQHGEAISAILAAVEDPDIALVLMTTHGRTAQEGTRLGHVAEAVIARTSRPILLVRPEAVTRYLNRSSRVHRLLFPLDGTSATTEALHWAIDLAVDLHSAIDVLYVIDPRQGAPREVGSIGIPTYVDQPQHEWPEWICEVVERLCEYRDHSPPPVDFRIFLVQGEAGAEIVHFAEEHDDDIIALVRRSRFERSRARILRAIVHTAGCPVLVLGAIGPQAHDSRKTTHVREHATK